MMEPETEEQAQHSDWKTILLDEALWLLRTLGIVSLSLAIGRVITYLTKGGGIDPNVLQGNWQHQVDEALRKREQQTQRTDDDEEEEET
jgi:hypothetical protein